MYLTLYHGRTDPDQDMNGWGTPGPTFEITNVIWTYGSLTRFLLPNDGEVWVGDMIVDDMIYYDGVYYGDFSISDRAFTEVSDFDETKLSTITKQPAE